MVNYKRKAPYRRRARAVTTIARAWRNRKARRTRNPRAMRTAGQTYSFKRVEMTTNDSVTTASIGSTNPGFVGLAFDFHLDQIQDMLAFPALFDSYKIQSVHLEIIPLRNSYGAPNAMPQVATCYDYDDSTLPVNMEKLLCRDGAYSTSFARKVSRFVKPKVASTIFSSALASGYHARTAWLDLSSPVGNSATIPHFGIKVGFLATPGQVISFHLKKTYHLLFKEPVVR